MFNADDLLKLIKKTSMDAMNASKPANMVFGKVISISPLKIQVDQKLILTSAQLVLSRQVTDYSVKVSFDWVTETVGDHQHNYSDTTKNSSGGSGDSSFASHSHTYSGTTEANGSHNHKISSSTDKSMTVHNSLTVGEEVIMMQVSGGQKYIVIDRIGKV